ncbi:hypothetical protein M405DRAFT_929822 [Rhizopogon salebrosus TDB-379]|nr:hypothetical protein M405DRAFT_929822 [Rhizopogon salebrosus TDB-379]
MTVTPRRSRQHWMTRPAKRHKPSPSSSGACAKPRSFQTHLHHHFPLTNNPSLHCLKITLKNPLQVSYSLAKVISSPLISVPPPPLPPAPLTMPVAPVPEAVSITQLDPPIEPVSNESGRNAIRTSPFVIRCNTGIRCSTSSRRSECSHFRIYPCSPRRLPRHGLAVGKMVGTPA